MRYSPPLTPFLFLGMALDPIPLAAARRLAAPALYRVARTLEPRLRDRMTGMQGTVALLPTDLPFGLLFCQRNGNLTAELVAGTGTRPADAVIRAPVQVFLDLASGEGLDGDGSFFARALVMEGDTALSMAFRYALEEADLKPEELVAAVTAAPPRAATRLAQTVGRLHEGVANRLNRFQDALLQPVTGRLDRVERQSLNLRDEVAALGKAVRRRGKPVNTTNIVSR